MTIAASAGSCHARRHSRHPGYQPRRPEDSVLYQVVAEYLETFLEVSQDPVAGRLLPTFVEREFRAFLGCGVLAHGFARVRCEGCGDSVLVGFSCKGRGFCPSCGGRRMASTAAHLVDHVLPEVPVRHWVRFLPIPLRFLAVYRPAIAEGCLRVLTGTIFEWMAQSTGSRIHPRSGCGAVSFRQRSGGALNLNLHFHLLVTDGCFDGDPEDPSALVFKRLEEPSGEELQILERLVAERTISLLEEQGLLEEGELALDPEELVPRTSLDVCQGASLGSSNAFDASAAAVPRREGQARRAGMRGARADLSGRSFSLWAGSPIEPWERESLERLCRYVARPAVCDERLEMTDRGEVRLQLSRPHDDGTTHLVFDGVEFLGRLAALVPRPRTHLVRYHGILAPNAALRSEVVPGGAKATPADLGARAGRTFWIPWALLLKRTFGFEVLRCDRCGGRRKVLAMITDPTTIVEILRCLGLPTEPPAFAASRAERHGTFAWN